MYNNLFCSSKEILINLDKVLSDESINQDVYFSGIYNAYYFLANVTSMDLFTLKNCIIDYIIKKTKNNSSKRQCILNNLFGSAYNKDEYILHFLNTVIYSIEELSLKGIKSIISIEGYFNLLLDLLRIDKVVVIWRESDKFIKDFKAIFKFSHVKLKDDIANFIKSGSSSKDILNHFYNLNNKIYNKEDEQFNDYYNRISKVYSDLIVFIMTDKRNIELTDKIKLLNKSQKNLSLNHSLLKQMLVTTINSGYNFSRSNIESLLFLYGNSNESKVIDFENLASSFMFPAIKYLKDNYLFNLNGIKIEPWIYRTSDISWFYNEIGLGGTITHLTKEYLHIIENNKEIKINKCDFNGELHHRMMKLSYIILKELGIKCQDFINNISKYDNINKMNIKDYGLESINNAIRPIIGVFNVKNQEILYSYSFFIIKLINNLRDIQKEIIYFIPKFVVEIPLYCFNILSMLNSPLLKAISTNEDDVNDNSYNKNIYIEKINNLNKQIGGSFISSSYKSKANNNEENRNNKLCNTVNYDENIPKNELNYIYQITAFYNQILADNNINNPEIIENLIKTIYTFVKYKFSIEIYVKNSEILVDFLKAHIKHLPNQSLKNAVFNNIYVLMKPGCYSSNYNSNTSLSIKESYKKCFAENKELYNHFLDAYVNLLNDDMTRYSTRLANLTKQASTNNNYSSNNNIENILLNIKPYFIEFENSINHFNEVMIIYEILIYSSPTLLDTDSFCFSRFVFFIDNLCSRVFSENFVKEVSKFSKDFNSNKINSLYFSIINIFAELFNVLNMNLKEDQSISIKRHNKFISAITKYEIKFNEFRNAIKYNTDNIDSNLNSNDIVQRDKFIYIIDVLQSCTDEYINNKKNDVR